MTSEQKTEYILKVERLEFVIRVDPSSQSTCVKQDFLTDGYCIDDSDAGPDYPTISDSCK